MNALFLTFHGFSEYNGISKKIYSQVKALNQCGVHTVLCHTSFDASGNQVRMIGDEDIIRNFGQSVWSKITKRISWGSLYDYIMGQEISFVYMRSDHNANPFLIHFLRRLRKSGVKVVMEIPTYPYDQEYKTLRFLDKISLFVDQLFRKRLAKELYRIVAFVDREEIFGVPVITISNGIDFDVLPMKHHLHDNPQKINLMGVAEIHYWHAFDRVIAGLEQYYRSQPETEVTFHVVGEGFQGYAQQLYQQAVKAGVSNYVVFHGNKSGKELDEMFELADIGIASLGRHRSGITHIKTLKNREYAARGIPFVYSEIDEDFESMPYILKAPADETPLDIRRIVDFYHTVVRNPAAIRASIEGTLSWKVQMESVLKVVKNEESNNTSQSK